MEERYSTEDAATGDMGIQTLSVGKEASVPRSVLMGKEANTPSCIPVRECSGEDLRNTASLLKGVKAPKAENRS